MSADDRLDPVLVIAPTGSFDPIPGTPLYDILCGDVQKRVADADANGALCKPAWAELRDTSSSWAVKKAYAGLSSIDDVRVEPIVKSKWNQSTVGSKNVYNYYTPNNYVCGCVATAGSQIMRHHKYPRSNYTVPKITHTCWVGGSEVSKTMMGGTYSWNDMPLVPTSDVTETECQAIGKLCYDVGVAIYMSWNSGGSGTGAYCLTEAFNDIFNYKNSIAYQLNGSTMSSTVIQNALLANFDAGYPVELSIESSSGGHSIVADGYGYDDGTLYIHLNMGWGGSADAWYNLPNIGTGYNFNVADGTVYNIFPEKTGDLLTGRVLDAATGEPIAGATVQAFNGSTLKGSATTNSKGIYALLLPGDVTYSVTASASGAETSTMSVYLEKSESTWTDTIYFYPGTGSVGNSWGNDFQLVTAVEEGSPAAPSGVSATDGTSTSIIRVTWAASSGATYYKVYRSTTSSTDNASFVAQVTSLYYEDSNVSVDQNYYYWVVAGNTSGESDWSEPDSGYLAWVIPDSPTGLSASDGTSTAAVTLTWNAVTVQEGDVASYTVWRSESSEFSSATEIMGVIPVPSYTDTSAVPGVPYWYWVTVTSFGGTSAPSDPDTGYRAVAKPSAPTGVDAADGLSATEIVVYWDAVDTAASYSVWRATSNSSGAATCLAEGLTVTSYSDTTAVAGTKYYYWVKATNVGGTSGFSASDSGYLADITGPATVTASDGDSLDYIRVTWQASENATAYQIWRGTVNAYSRASLIATQASTTYDDHSPTPGAYYYYWVKAVTPSGTSSFSASDSGYRMLAAPTGVSATEGNSNGVTVTWTGVAGATSYEIGRGDEDATEPASVIGTATSASYIDTTAVPGETYTYFVRAKAAACFGAWSDGDTGSRLVPSPSNLNATDGTRSDCICVTWTALSGAQNYELVRAPENNFDYAVPVATLSGNSFLDTTAEYDVTYYYWLRANFAAGTSSWSASESGRRAVPVPTGVTATRGTNSTRITISWNAIEGASFYQIWRYSAARRRNEFVGTSTTTTFNNSANIEPGIKYTYRVKAVFPTATSGFSEAAEGYLKSLSPAVKASDGTYTDHIALTWTLCTNATTYVIYRGATKNSSEASPIGSTSMLYYDDKSAESGVIYYYWVKTKTYIDEADFADSDTGYRSLAAVSRISATDGASADSITVSWSAVSGAGSYSIWRGATSEYSAATRIKTGVKDLSYEDTEAVPGVKYWYWVRAYDVGYGLLGTANDTGYRLLTTPTSVAASNTATNGVRVTWSCTKDNGVSFEIRRSETSSFSSAATVATVSGVLAYTDNTAVPGRVYYYWVQAYSDNSTSGWAGPAMGYRAVAAPANVTATDGTSLEAVTITWDAATYARCYEIWRTTTSKSDDAELLGTTNRLVWVDSTAVPGTRYYYWLKSVSLIDTSAFSLSDIGYVSTAVPTGVMATDGEGTNYVNVVWEAAEGANSYAVYRSENESLTSPTRVTNNVTVLEFKDKTVVPGKFYWYWVRSIAAAGLGLPSEADSGYASLTLPIGLTASTNNSTRVNVTWRKTNGADYYELFRSETDDIDTATNEVYATVIPQGTATTIMYGDTNAMPVVRYYYWLRACSTADISPIAGPVDGYRLLTAPTGVSASDGTSDQYIQVTWRESVNAESYEIWRAQNSTSTAAAELVGTTNECIYLDTEATAGISYSYWLKAVSELSKTGFSSSTDKGWRSLPAPASVDASDGGSSTGIEVTWEPVEGAVKYEIWRNTGDEPSTDGLTKAYYTTASAAVTSYKDTKVDVGVKYWYWVRTVASTGTGVFSEPDSGYRAIAVPANLKATDGTSYDYVRVTWGAVTGAVSYEITRVPTNELYSVTTNVYEDVTGTKFDDTNAVPGTVYYYSIRAKSAISMSEYSPTDVGWRKFQKIDDLVASDGESLDGVALAWTIPEGARECEIWRAEAVKGAVSNIIATVSEPAYLDETALHGVKYRYWVTGLADISGELGTSDDGWRALVTPGDIVATDGDSTSHVRITWSESEDATMYEILRGPSEDFEQMKPIATNTVAGVFAYEDVTAVPSSNYWYSVRAGGTGGWSDYGVPDSGYRSIPAPQNVIATDGTYDGGVQVTWDAVDGATHYQVYRADSEMDAKNSISKWITATSFVDTTCRAEVRYIYYVRAASDLSGALPSLISAGDIGYSLVDGEPSEESGDVELGGGISWPVIDNGDGTVTTNAIEFASIEGGKLVFSGIAGEVGATTTVHALVKTSLGSDDVYTVPATLEIVAEGTGEVDLSNVWGARSSLFVIGVGIEEGDALPEE